MQNQVQEVPLQDKLGKQNFRYITKRAFDPDIDIIEDTSRDITKTISESSIENNEVLENLNDKLLEIMNDRVIIAFYLMSLLSKITNPENTSQFKLVKDLNSNTVSDLLLHNTIVVTLYDNLFTFHDSEKKFELKEDLQKLRTNKNYNVDLASLSDKKIVCFCKGNEI